MAWNMLVSIERKQSIDLKSKKVIAGDALVLVFVDQKGKVYKKLE
jgi:hypothetical protein